MSTWLSNYFGVYSSNNYQFVYLKIKNRGADNDEKSK